MTDRTAPLDIHNVYPSIKELIPEQLRHIMPHSLCTAIAERYAAFGGKYMTDAIHDGRKVNGVMDCDNLQSMNEEVIDAVFNWLAWSIVEHGEVDVKSVETLNPDMAEAFGHLVRAYSIIAEEHTNVQLNRERSLQAGAPQGSL